MKKFRYEIYHKDVLITTINAVDKDSLKEALYKMGYNVVNSFVTKRGNDCWEGTIICDNYQSFDYKRYKN